MSERRHRAASPFSNDGRKSPHSDVYAHEKAYMYNKWADNDDRPVIKREKPVRPISNVPQVDEVLQQIARDQRRMLQLQEKLNEDLVDAMKSGFDGINDTLKHLSSSITLLLNDRALDNASLNRVYTNVPQQTINLPRKMEETQNLNSDYYKRNTKQYDRADMPNRYLDDEGNNRDYNYQDEKISRKRARDDDKYVEPIPEKRSDVPISGNERYDYKKSRQARNDEDEHLSLTCLSPSDQQNRQRRNDHSTRSSPSDQQNRQRRSDYSNERRFDQFSDDEEKERHAPSPPQYHNPHDWKKDRTGSWSPSDRRQDNASNDGSEPEEDTEYQVRKSSPERNSNETRDFRDRRQRGDDSQRGFGEKRESRWEQRPLKPAGLKSRPERCFECGGPGHRRNECTHLGQMYCYNCERYGTHKAKECRELGNDQTRRRPSQYQGGSNSGPRGDYRKDASQRSGDSERGGDSKFDRKEY